MLFGIMQVIALFYYWTWFIWPFVFVFFFSYGIVDLIKEKEGYKVDLVCAAISLLIILTGITWPAMA